MPSKISYVDLFAGCGGLSFGFHKNSSFRHVMATDSWKAAKDTYDINFKGSNYLLEDLSSESGLQRIINEIPDNMDLIIGGPPCVGFSTLNNSKTESKYNTLVDQYLRIVEKVLPKAFLIENVRTFYSKKHPSGITYPEHIKKRLKSFTKEYNYQEIILNAVDFGIAQNRIRYFFVAVQARLNKNGKLLNSIIAEIEAQKTQVHSTLKDAIGDLPRVPVCKGQDIIKMPNGKVIYNHKSMNHSEDLIERLKHVPEGGGLLNVPVSLLTDHLRKMVSGTYGSGGFAKNIYGRMTWTKPSGTIIAGMDKITVGRFVHPKENRLLTPRECARIQSFPDDFIFPGGMVTQYYLIGNAVPPKLSVVLAKALSHLENCESKRKEKLMTCN